MVGASKTEAGSGRVIPLNERAPMTLQTWATNFSAREPEHSVFPSEHYGLAGNDRTVHAKTIDPNTAIGEIKGAWESAKSAANVSCRFHDLRHTACTRLLEHGASLPIVASIMGWSASTTAKMATRYGHIGADTQRAALEALTGAPPPKKRATGAKAKQALHSRIREGWAQNWAQCPRAGERHPRKLL